ncbi:Transcription initiation factor TFIID component TAF4 [Sesbania bispinosa]|nr:Transcription initiation factor TFIID component TAF4 [Sesbania bispinosa]
MDPSIMKLLEDDEDETMHSGVDVEAFQAALNRDIGGDASTSQFSGSDTVLSQGINNTTSQSLPHWPALALTAERTVKIKSLKPAVLREQPSSEMELKQHGSLVEQLQHVASQDVVKTHNPNSESQYAKLQQMSNQQASVTEQPNEIAKDSFVRLMKGIVGDQMLRLALAKVQMQSQTRPNQGPAGHSTLAVSQEETERSSVHIQGLNKQQQHHLHFPSAYGSSSDNYNPFSGTTSNSSSSIKPQLHDSHMSHIPHQSIGSNHLGRATQGLNVIGMPKHERQNSFNDPKRLAGGSLCPAVNNTASQQASNAWQPSTNKEQNLGSLSSVSYVKKEPSDLSAEQQHRHNLSKLHGLPSVNSAQIEQGSANQGTVKDEFSRGLPASTSVPPTTSTGLLPLNSTSPSVMTQLDPNVSSSAQNPSNASGVIARTTLKKPPLAQKKPLESLSSSPPPSKKQKTSGGSVEQSIEQLNDVTAVSGVDLREEEEQLFSGPKEDSRVSEACRKAVQEEEERLILQKAPLQKKLIDIMAKCGLKGMSNDVERCLSLCVEERMRGLISNLIRLSKQRVDFEKTSHRTVVTSDVESNTGVDGDKEKDESRTKSTKVNKEEDEKTRMNALNVAARAAFGGDDMFSKWQLMAEQARQKREGGVDASSGSQPAKDVNRKSITSGRSTTTKDNQGEKKGPTTFFATAGAARKFGRNHAVASQARVDRSISVKDVIAVLEREPQMSKSPLIHRLYEKIHSDASVE